MIFFDLCIRIFTVSNAFGNFYSSQIRTNSYFLAQNPQKIFIRESRTLFNDKTLRIQGKTPTVWYSHQCTPASHHSRCTLTANKIAPLVFCKSIRTHFHHFTSSRPPSSEKTPKAMADKGKQPLEENSFPPKKRTIRE
jgi:hypothetical protein